MTAAPGIVTSGTGPPNAVVQVQPGMIVQPVVLVDQNGQYLTGSGSAATAGYLADLTGTVNVSAATAPAVNQSLIATSGSTATWQFTPIAGGGTGGTTATAALTNLGAAALAGAAFTGEVTVQAPVNPSDAVTKAYADAIASGLSVKPSVQEATAAALPANVYGNGSSGVGATLTAALPGVLTVDGITVALGDRILVQDEAAAANNGIYVVTTLGTVGVAYVLTRATDMDTPAQIPGAFCFSEQGTVNAGAGFVVASEGPFTIGTTAITWTQFSGTGEITAGTGLTKTGNTIALTVPASVADGGTGGTTATLAFGNLSPMTTLGDMLFQNSTPAAARLAGNTSATKKFLTQTGNGTVSANPAWGTIVTTDLPPSVALTGTPTAPTGTAGDASTQIATDAFVAAAVTAAEPPWTAADQGFLAWPFDPVICTSAAGVGAGNVWYTRVQVRQAITCTNVNLVITVAGGGLTANENFAGLFNSAGTLIGATADQSSNWTGTGLMTMALAGGPYVLPAGFYWVAILANGGTTPTIPRAPNVSALLTGANLTTAQSRFAVSAGGKTSLASFTPSTFITANGQGFWSALS